MARLKEFGREIRLATTDLEPEAISRQLARMAREALAEAIASDEASPRYSRFVNGRADAPEESVKPPGPILYLFDYLDDVAAFALDWARAASPVESGRYRDAWFIMADGAPVGPDAIPVGTETLTITNEEPYHRKIDVGHMKLSVPPHIVDRMRIAVMGRYGNLVTARATMILLAGGYVLKGHFRKGFRPGARTSLREDTAAGMPMTYPALEIRARGYA